MNEYSFEVSAQETWVALECEADRAEREGFLSVAKRQREYALHLRNAWAHMAGLVPDGHRQRVRLVFDTVPNVNAYLRDDVREGRS